MSGAQLRVWAVLPAKSFVRGKSRLRSMLGDAAREALARNMFQHVLALTRGHAALAGTLVITDGDDVAALAAAGGCVVLRDPAPDTTLAGVVDSAVASLHARADVVLVLMTDLPRATADDLDAMLRALQGNDVVIAPDARGHHTNALALRLGHGYSTRFGATESLREHAAHALELGLRVAHVARAGLAYDIDVAGDLAEAEASS